MSGILDQFESSVIKNVILNLQNLGAILILPLQHLREESTLLKSIPHLNFDRHDSGKQHQNLST